MPVTTRVTGALSSIVKIRPGEGRMTALMFAYAFEELSTIRGLGLRLASGLGSRRDRFE